MEKRGLFGLWVILFSATTVNSEWLSSGWSSPWTPRCDSSPWREFPLIPLRIGHTWPLIMKQDWPLMHSLDVAWSDELAQTWPLIMKHDWPVTTFQDEGWWDEDADRRHSGFDLCATGNDRLHHYPKQQQSGQSLRYFSSDGHSTDQPVHQPSHHPESSPTPQLYKTQPNHHRAQPEHQGTMTHHKEPIEHDEQLKHHRGPPEHEAPLKPPREQHGHQVPAGPQKGPSIHKPSEHSSQSSRYPIPELEKVLTIPLQGFSPTQLKIIHHGSHIRVSASRTCSSSDRCVTREMEKTYDLPFPIAKGSMKASVDPELNVVIIKGLPTEGIEPQSQIQLDAQLTGPTEEDKQAIAEAEVLAEDEILAEEEIRG